MGDERERAWLEAALDRHEGPLLRYAASLVGRAAAPDVVQDTFLALCRTERAKVEGHLAPWLFVVCRRRALELLREGRRLEALDTNGSAEAGSAGALSSEQALLPEKLEAAERSQIDALLSGDAGVRELVGEIRGARTRLERALKAPEGPRLSAIRREHILASLTNGATPGTAPESTAPESTAAEARKPRPRRLHQWLLLAALLPAIAVMVTSFGEQRSSLVPAAPSDIDGAENANRVVEPIRAHVERGVVPVPRTVERTPAFSVELPAEMEALAAVPPLPGLLSPREAQSAGVAPATPPPVAFALEPRRGHGDALDFESRLGHGDEFAPATHNAFIDVAVDPLSTFSIDVDTASYSVVRRHLQASRLPPAGAVRIEEMVNYFSYDYPEPPAGEAFSIHTDVARAPWAPEHQLVRVGITTREMAPATRPPANLVFLVDVSGSMQGPDRLDLVKRGLEQLVDTLGARDRIAIVVYAGGSGVVLPPTSAARKGDLLSALRELQAGGSTNGGAGIRLAYDLAAKHFVRGGVNRVILATDGDFNVGVTNQSDLVDLIVGRAKTGVFLSVLGFGSGNYADATMELLADRGNGNYAYIDGPSEARKVLVEQATSTLVTVAKDVKLQLEFNSREVSAYRLLGYENRVLAHREFNDDSKDAGDVGAGHRITALYEIVPAGKNAPGASMDALKYQPAAAKPASGPEGELLTVKLRHQSPAGGASRKLEHAVRATEQPLQGDFRFAVAVAEFGMLLRHTPERGSASFEQVLDLARPALGSGPDRERRDEFVALVEKARDLQSSRDPLSAPMP